MRQEAKNLQFEKAAAMRDQVVELKRLLVAEEPLVPAKWLTSSAEAPALRCNGSINASPVQARSLRIVGQADRKARGRDAPGVAASCG